MAQFARTIPRFLNIRSPRPQLQTSLKTSTTGAAPVIPPGAIAKEAWHKDYNPTLENQTFTHQGRTIGFAEYGSPSGIPAFFFHGAPGSRYDGIAYDESAKKLDVRIICPDRPGHGLSTFVPRRRLIDYPSDISSLAQYLRLNQYHVFGQSGGGPYAVACAHLTPKDELLNVGVVAGMGPPETVTFRMAGWYTVLALWLHRNLPNLLKRFAEWQYPASSIQDDERLQKIIDKSMRWLPAETRKELEEISKAGDPQKEFRAHIQCMFAQGWAGTIRDAQIYGSLWGFRLEDVTKRVLLVYGGKDVRTPVAFGRWYEEHLQNAELIELAEEGHISIGLRSDEILAKLTGKEEILRNLQEEEARGRDANDVKSARQQMLV